MDITGTNGNDILTGTVGDDRFYNIGTGADKIDGVLGKDSLSIGNANDPSNININYTNLTNGKITNGNNNGTTFKHIDTVSFSTGTGNDYINVSAANGNNYIDAGVGNNTIVSGAGNDVINTGGGNDAINAGAGDDTISSGAGADIIDGGAGKDNFFLNNFGDTANTTITYSDPSKGSIVGGSNNGTTFKNIEAVDFTTGSGNDYINVSAAAGTNYIDTGAGNDTILGGAGNENIMAGAGDDLILSGAGADTIDGGAGNDYLSIKNASDITNTTISYSNSASGSILGGSNNGTTFQNIEIVEFTTGSGDDIIDVSAANKSTIVAGAGNDTIFGSAIGANYILGGDGDDKIVGGAGNDTLIGGAGNDTLTGGGGKDLLTGGGGSNTFHFGDTLNPLGIATITDYTVGADKVELGKFYFTGLTTPTGLSLIATDFSTVVTDLDAATATGGIVYNNSNGKLFYNADGSAAGFGIDGGQFAQLTSGLALTNNDFIATL
jgi:Ca2+-binding RTX toxin-like protein